MGWVAGGEWYEESKRDWIICCPAFVQRGYGPFGGLGVFAFGVLERSLFDIALPQPFLGDVSLMRWLLLWWVRVGGAGKGERGAPGLEQSYL